MTVHIRSLLGLLLSLVSWVDARNLLHLRDEACPVVLLGKVHTHICPIPVDRADHTHTLMCDRAPLIPKKVQENERECRAELEGEE